MILTLKFGCEVKSYVKIYVFRWIHESLYMKCLIYKEDFGVFPYFIHILYYSNVGRLKATVMVTFQV